MTQESNRETHFAEAAGGTVRFSDREFQGMYSPRLMAEVGNALSLARLITRRAAEQE